MPSRDQASGTNSLQGGDAGNLACKLSASYKQTKGRYAAFIMPLTLHTDFKGQSRLYTHFFR